MLSDARGGSGDGRWAVSTLFQVLEDFAVGMEDVAGRLADWAHGLHCDICRREQA